MVLPTNNPVTPPEVASETPVKVTDGLLTVTVDPLLTSVPLIVAVMDALPTATQLAKPGLTAPTFSTLTKDELLEFHPVTASP